MKSSDLGDVRRTLWRAADELRANSTLTPVDYRGPVLGLIFLAYAEHRFEAVFDEVAIGAFGAHGDALAVDEDDHDVLDARDAAIATLRADTDLATVCSPV